MANIVFCIEVRQDRLLAVRLAAGPYVDLVIGCAEIKTNIWPFDEAVARLKEEAGFDEGIVLLTFAPELLLLRNLKVPFTDKKKIGQILPMELMESLPVDVESLIIDFMITDSNEEGAEIIAGMLPRELLSTTINALAAEGLNPETIGAGGVATCLNLVDEEERDFLLLDLQATGVGITILVDGQMVLARFVSIDVQRKGIQPIVAEVQRTLIASRHFDKIGEGYHVFLTGISSLHQSIMEPLQMLLEGAKIQIYRQSSRPLTKINAVIRDKYRPGAMDGLLATTVRGSDASGNFNYRKDEFRKKKNIMEHRHRILQVVAPIAACLAIFIGYQAYTYSQMASRQEELNQQIVGVYKETVPSATRIVSPVKQLEALNKEISKNFGTGKIPGDEGYSMIDLLTEISARIPSSYQVTISRLVADLETLRLRGVTTDFNTVDNIQKELEKSLLFREVDINSANQSPQNDEVRFELKLQLTN